MDQVNILVDKGVKGCCYIKYYIFPVISEGTRCYSGGRVPEFTEDTQPLEREIVQSLLSTKIPQPLMFDDDLTGLFSIITITINDDEDLNEAEEVITVLLKDILSRHFPDDEIIFQPYGYE